MTTNPNPTIQTVTVGTGPDAKVLLHCTHCGPLGISTKTTAQDDGVRHLLTTHVTAQPEGQR